MERGSSFGSSPTPSARCVERGMAGRLKYLLPALAALLLLAWL